MLILEDNGDVNEVPDEDCEVEGDGFWLLAAEDEEFEDFYEFVDVSFEPEDEEQGE